MNFTTTIRDISGVHLRTERFACLSATVIKISFAAAAAAAAGMDHVTRYTTRPSLRKTPSRCTEYALHKSTMLLLQQTNQKSRHGKFTYRYCQSVTAPSSLNSFKNRLDKYWLQQDITGCAVAQPCVDGDTSLLWESETF